MNEELQAKITEVIIASLFRERLAGTEPAARGAASLYDWANDLSAKIVTVIPTTTPVDADAPYKS